MSIPSAPPFGCLYGVGVGPGDPELISVKGLRALQQVPVVAFPAGVKGKTGVAERIIEPWLNSTQQKLPLTFPYVQDPSVLEAAWQQAAQEVGKYLVKGQDVAFASEGDVSFYSTFTYLSQNVQALYPDAKVETIPGISSPMTAAAAVGLPLTVQRDRLAILPALYCLDDLTTALTWADVIVLMKAGSVYEQVWPILQQAQLLDHSYVIVEASTPQQQIYQNLQNYPTLKLPYFSLLIVYVKNAPQRPTIDPVSA
ncbi:MAG: precorrin-2 C(20)-methyltransferase [Thermosynechococcaceae cyanobacterium]